MKVLAFNCGSSSIKCYLYESDTPLWESHLQWKNDFQEVTLQTKNSLGQKREEKISQGSIKNILSHLVNTLTQGDTAVMSSLDEVDVIGHRIVHGGKYFKEATLIDEDVKEKIKQVAKLAPLHNLLELEGIEVLEELFPDKPQVAVFDTAFHSSLPTPATIYPGPYKWYKEGILRYGFHGISFSYCLKRAKELITEDINKQKIIICHLGSGASLCAIKDGKSVDTTMGFTPLDGLMMGTRSGSIDPGIILHLLHNKKCTLEELSQDLYQSSGLLGVSELSSDMKDILDAYHEDDPHAALAFEVYLHRLNSLIGSMVATLQGVDLLIFTAGIGENVPLLRERVCDNFSFLGIDLDKQKNDTPSLEDQTLSTSQSKVKVLLLHTKEALEIARECIKKIG